MAENHYITKTGIQGSVHISEEVIAAIVTESVREVEGITGFATSLGGEIAERLGKKASSKGVKVYVEENEVKVDLFVLVQYGTVISEIANAVQEKVASTMEAMTGVVLHAVNVTVCGIAFERK